MWSVHQWPWLGDGSSPEVPVRIAQPTVPDTCWNPCVRKSTAFLGQQVGLQETSMTLGSHGPLCKVAGQRGSECQAQPLHRPAHSTVT